VSPYVESSALLKRYVDESNSETAESFLRSDPSLLTARHMIVEVRRNLARLLDEREAAAARSAFLEDLGVLSMSSWTMSPARWPLPSPR
jgi:predicted nucleic acid-binding protein